MADSAEIDEPLTSRQIGAMLIKLPCLACAFWSCGIVAFGTAWMVQVYFDSIPHGKIVRTQSARGGVHVYLDNGRDAVFPNWFSGDRKPVSAAVKLDSRGFLQLAPGDTVAKPVHGFVYSVNGAPLTDMRWQLHRAFLDAPMPLLFALFVVLAIVHTLVVPGGDLLEFNKRPDPSVSVRSLGLARVIRKGFLRPMLVWLVGAVLIFLFVEIVGRVLVAVARAVLGKG